MVVANPRFPRFFAYNLPKMPDVWGAAAWANSCLFCSARMPFVAQVINGPGIVPRLSAAGWLAFGPTDSRQSSMPFCFFTARPPCF